MFLGRRGADLQNSGRRGADLEDNGRRGADLEDNGAGPAPFRQDHRRLNITGPDGTVPGLRIHDNESSNSSSASGTGHRRRSFFAVVRIGNRVYSNISIKKSKKSMGILKSNSVRNVRRLP